MSQLGPQIDAIHDRYRSRFAGFPRLTRDPELLEQILADARALHGAGGFDADEKKRLDDNVALYERELDGIREAQRAGPAALQIHRLANWANFVQARYARRFAGQQRRSRDLGLLAELVEDATRLLEQMREVQRGSDTDELRQAIDLTEQNLKVYRIERERIREDRKKVFGAERGTLFARLANDQFARYRLHFAQKSRLSRSERLLGHICDALQEVLDGMEALLADGYNAETHVKNIELVRNNLGVYKSERVNIRTALRESSLDDRVGWLGGAANDVFKVYRENFAGKSRQTRDLDLLHDQIELLFHVGLQMDAIDREHDHDTNAKNLALVMDMLYLYHREYNQVQQIQQPTKA